VLALVAVGLLCENTFHRTTTASFRGVDRLEKTLRSVGDVYTVAPDREQNSMSHALTLHRPLRVHELNPKRFAVDGTPTDCVKLALAGLLDENRMERCEWP
jgi:5'/3'-nucleotidase SurE